MTPAKVNAIRGEFMRQCDALDGLADGIINNYMACRAIFDVSAGRARTGIPGRRSAARTTSIRIPADTSADACLTDGQISTLEFIYSRYRFATPLANGAQSFGMWVPNTDPSGSGLILDARFSGQEGAAADARDALAPRRPRRDRLPDEGPVGQPARLRRRRRRSTRAGRSCRRFSTRRTRISSAFQKRGGKMIVTIGTNDTLASPGAQLDYYQSVLDKMGRATVDRFARLFVMPQTGHGLSGTQLHTWRRRARLFATAPIPNRYDQTRAAVRLGREATSRRECRSR